ncbi:hypothetical protein DCAR_0415083 [Daucus carota subsp. sativus]|uniref:ATP-dependent RNA helicase Ski2/MTR4 C-terminal domain-containing protein n=1 Tax=Daucus carota subsp. sativus TaxID=79200 RepID=A0AAF0WVN1_DAUCS|nr:hypothetical protein DCAR_0415083 [Daucus carota subsp. sativus]
MLLPLELMSNKNSSLALRITCQIKCIFGQIVQHSYKIGGASGTGTPFADICELTDVPEGLIVRTIVRLDETCREFKNAAAIMGNSALHKKMEIASNAIKRDIVFAASLYITGV